MKTLTRVYHNHSQAVATVQALEAAGFDHQHVSILTHRGAHDSRLGSADDPSVNERSPAASTTQADDTTTGAGTGASIGALVGGGLGLVAGLGALAIPGLGVVVAAGWLVSTLTGAGLGAALGGAGGGLVAALVGAGHSEAEAQAYAETVRQGGTLVTARVDDSRQSAAERILNP